MSSASAASVLEMSSARSYAESMMESTCTVNVLLADPPMDPDTGRVGLAVTEVVYSGKCRVRPTGTMPRVTTAGAAEVFAFDYVVSLPFDAAGTADVREGMTCIISSSPDPALVGLELQVQKVDRGEHITARRLSCNEVA